MAFTLTMLSWGVIDYRDAYEQAGQLEYGRTAIRWGTDYFLKCHSQNMTLYAQVGDAELDHAYWGRPEDMTMDRPSLKIDVNGPGSDLAGEASAALAAASIVFAVSLNILAMKQDSDPEYSAELLAASRDLFVFADEYRATYHESLPEIGNYYVSPDYGDELCWAAVWLYRATEEQQYRDKARNLWEEFDMGLPVSFFDWGTVNAGVQALYGHVFGDLQYKDAAQKFTEGVRNATHTPGGLVYLTQWGCLRHAVNAAFIAIKVAELAIQPTTNRAWAEQQAQYVLGSSGRSYVIGYGVDYPQRPHHRSSSCPDAPEPCDSGWALNQAGPNPQVLYGALVGGPDINDNHSDDRSDYVHNEVSLNYNSGLACLMAAMASQ
ncbi:Glycoside hydrolase family 9 [Trinorchestia longiramus]|nr:Glycoside hydrolase family 9 [Trinorchestia longiramus]